MTDPARRLSWRALENRVGLSALPAFHCAFLRWRGVDGADDLPVRRAGQRVQAELNRMVQGDLATRQGDDWHLIPGALEGFEEAAPYLPQESDSLPM